MWDEKYSLVPEEVLDNAQAMVLREGRKAGHNISKHWAARIGNVGGG